MKKLILLTILTLCVNSAFAYDYNPVILDNGIRSNQIITFCQRANAWNKNCQDDLKFVHHYTIGSGGYSEYEHNGKIYDTDTVYEFLYGDKLIGYNPYKLKFFELTFENDSFVKKVLTDEQIKELFPNVELVKISQFKKDEITLYKSFLKKKTFLFVNDTDREFYKYQFENYRNQTEFIHGIFEPRFARTYIYSHFGGRDKEIPPLKIVVKNRF